MQLPYLQETQWPLRALVSDSAALTPLGVKGPTGIALVYRDIKCEPKRLHLGTFVQLCKLLNSH